MKELLEKLKVEDKTENEIDSEYTEEFRQRLDKEHITENPKIAIDIFYSAHGKRDDLQGIDERLEKADIFIPESFGWTPKGLEVYQSVSNGHITPSDAFEAFGFRFKEGKKAEATFLFCLFEKIYNSKKKIAFIDIPKESEAYKRFEKLYSSRFEIDPLRSFDYHLKSIRERFKKNALVQKEREKYMVTELKALADNIGEKFPEYAKKGKVNFLLFLGSVHTRVYHDFTKDNGTVSRSFGDHIYWGYQKEAIRKYLFGKEVSSDFLARCFLESIFIKSFGPKISTFVHSSNKEIAFFRKLTNFFDYKQAEELFNSITKEAKDISDIRFMTEKFLHAHDIILPKTEEELDKFLLK